MQSRRWQHHGSSGELDVFGATRYFAGSADRCATAPAVAQPPADSLTESFRGHDVEQLAVHDVAMMRHEKEMEHAKHAGKSNIATAFFGFFMVSSPSSPGASFRRRPPPPLPSPTSTTSTPTGDESVKVSSVSSATPSTRTSTGDDLPPGSSSPDDADDDVQPEGRRRGRGCYDGLDDLGVATGDRRLLGVKVVSSGAKNQQETWVVRCTPACCWDHHQGKYFDAAASRNANYYYYAEEEQDSTASPCDYHWESDSSSDLFDLDIESVEL